jgi:hypothetical protein
LPREETTGFLAAGFFATDFLAIGFLAAVLLAGDLRCADFDRADLGRTDLGRADLGRTDLGRLAVPLARTDFDFDPEWVLRTEGLAMEPQLGCARRPQPTITGVADASLHACTGKMVPDGNQ